MKKTLIISALAAGLVSVAFAAEGTSTVQRMPPTLPPMMSTGSSTLDAQIKALRQSYEAQIKALQQEYITQLKALVGDRMASSTRRGNFVPIDDGKFIRNASGTPRMEDGRRMGTTTSSGTPMMRGQRGGDQNEGDQHQGDQNEQDNQGQGQGRGDRGQMMGRPQVEGASTDNSQEQGQGQGGFMQFFRGFFGR